MAKPGAHPDANLLTAFAEKSLGERERALVLGHLAECPGCREVISVASAANEEWPGVPALPVRSRWLSWPVLRWGAAVACVVVVGTAVTLRYEWRSGPAPGPEQAAAPLPAPSAVLRTENEEKVGPEEKLAAKILPPSPIRSESSFGVAGRLAKAPASAAGKSAAIPSPINGVEETDQMQKKQVEANQPFGGYLTRDKLASVDAARSAQRPPAVQGQLAASAPAAPAAKATVMEPQARERLDDKDNPVHANSETVTVMAEALQVQTAQASVAKTKDDSRRKAQNDRGGAMAGMALGDHTSDMKSAETVSGGNKTVGREGNEAGGRWTIAADGSLQESPDAGRSWQAVAVASGVVFRALAANGPDIWAGGNAGALYHSSDAGQHWTQIKPQADGRALTGDITAVEFGDPQHGKLTTSTRETWITGDGGQTWHVD